MTYVNPPAVRIAEAGDPAAAEAPDAENGPILEFVRRLEGAGGGPP